MQLVAKCEMIHTGGDHMLVEQASSTGVLSIFAHFGKPESIKDIGVIVVGCDLNQCEYSQRQQAITGGKVLRPARDVKNGAIRNDRFVGKLEAHGI